MRRTVLALFALTVIACSSDDKPNAASSASTSAAPEPTTTDVATTTATAPTTVSPLTAIEGCPDPGPLAPPDPRRPTYTATATVVIANGTVTGSVTVDFTPDLDTDELVFRLWPNAPVLAASGVHEDVGPPVRPGDDAALAVDRPDDTTVRVLLPETLKAGNRITVTMPYLLTIPGGNADRVAREAIGRASCRDR